MFRSAAVLSLAAVLIPHHLVSAEDGAGASCPAYVAPLLPIQTACGDLNGDGRTDAALIVTEVRPGRIGFLGGHDVPALRVYLTGRDGAPGVVVASSRPVCGECTGSDVPPLRLEIAVDGGSLLLEYRGGAPRRRRYLTRWNLDRGDFRLVGFDRHEYDGGSGSSSSSSTDLRTGVQRVTRNTGSPEGERGTGCRLTPSVERPTLDRFAPDRLETLVDCETGVGTGS